MRTRVKDSLKPDCRAASVLAARQNSESEHFRHSLGEFVFGHRGVNLDGGQSQTRRRLAPFR